MAWQPHCPECNAGDMFLDLALSREAGAPVFLCRGCARLWALRELPTPDGEGLLRLLPYPPRGD